MIKCIMDINKESVNKFVSLFIRFEEICNSKYQNLSGYLPTNINTELEYLKTKDPLIRGHFDHIDNFRNLRNLLSHKIYVEEVKISALDKFEKIIDQIENPKKAFDVASKNIKTCKNTDNIHEIIKMMNEEVFTSIPIVDVNEKLIGVFSESILLEWMANIGEKDGCIFDKISIGELSEYTSSLDNKFSSFKFISRDEFAYKVEELFNDCVEKQIRLQAVFVTEHGKQNEKLLGIVTAWDLPRISK